MLGRALRLGCLAAALAMPPHTTQAARATYPIPPRGTVRIGSFYALDPTCATIGLPTVQLVAGPSNGTIEARHARDFPNFPTSNVRVKCDTRRVPVTEVLYRATPGFVGVDSVTYDIVFPRGQLRRYRRVIVVRPGAPPSADAGSNGGM
ncbi:hypothetical protein [Beijerinckia sp. L45]|uniref:hypothetical protein n=1 Tax=Beijerinckia sp. L45 TaxID=1641855 RepID=UPI00131A93B3|nr:hypothetical protein [Beijerinckia sp. L45]